MKALARFVKALSDETRLRILYLLYRHGELCVCDVHESMGISQSRASRHLRTLREAGLVRDQRVGLWMHYSIADDLDDGRRAVLDAVLTEASHLDEATELDGGLATWMSNKDRGKNACG